MSQPQVCRALLRQDYIENVIIFRVRALPSEEEREGATEQMRRAKTRGCDRADETRAKKNARCDRDMLLLTCERPLIYALSSHP